MALFLGLRGFEMKKLRCKDCKFYSGSQCHGHGEFWGSCRFLDDLEHFLDLVPNENCYKFICFDDTICHFIKDFGFLPEACKFHGEPLED